MADNMVYLVTGGNRGVGLGLVQSLLARESTTVIATVRNTEAATSLNGEQFTLGRGSQLYVVILDLSKAVTPAQVLEAIKAVTANTALDHVDVLINDAAVFPPLDLATETSAEDLRLAFEVNTIGPMMVFQAVWPLLQKSKTGTPKVIMVTSTVGSIGAQEPLAGGSYGPSKAALNWFARALHLQNAASGLVAIALHPGWVKTRAGDFSAKSWDAGVGPTTTVEESVRGILNVVDTATRDNYGGEFVMFTGEKWYW